VVLIDGVNRWKRGMCLTANILPEDQISLIFDTLRISYKKRSCQNLWFLTSLQQSDMADI